MRKLFFTLGAIGLFTVAAFAQNYPVKARVPFEFSAAGIQFSAGEYTIEPHSLPSILRIRDEAGHIKAFLQVTSTSRSNGVEAPALVFNRYGDQYFLSRVWNMGSNGSELMKSKIERELSASAAVPAEQVLVAAVYR